MQKQAYAWLPALSMGLYDQATNRENAERTKMLRMQAVAVNDQIRALLAARNQSMRDGLEHTRMPTILHAQRMRGLLSKEDMPLGYYDQGMIRLASDLGAELADMHKEAAGIGAGFGALFRGARTGVKNVAQGIQHGGRALANRGLQAVDKSFMRRNAQVGNAVSQVKNVVPATKAKVMGLNQTIGNKLEGLGQNLAAKGEAAGNNLTQRGMGLKPATPAAASPTVPAGVGTSRGSANTVGTGAPPVAKQPPPTAAPVQQQAAAQVQPQAAAPPVQPAVQQSAPTPQQSAATVSGKTPPPVVSASGSNAPQPEAQRGLGGQLAEADKSMAERNKLLGGSGYRNHKERRAHFDAQHAAMNKNLDDHAARGVDVTSMRAQQAANYKSQIDQHVEPYTFMGRAKADLGNGKWKAKAGLLALAGGASYGLYRGAKAGVNYLQSEHSPQQYNQGGVVPPQAVNQYGVPQRFT